MAQRINKAAQRRIEKALRSSYTMRQTKLNNGCEDRAEALSTVKKINVVRGLSL
tara:strand:- start:2937 stop:3098 length:162 start_codon:yes stop_codon:yes gene_type:complete